MKKNYFIYPVLFLICFVESQSQTLTQVGYYSVNGIMSLSDKPGFMLLGDGKMVDINNPTTPVVVGNVGFLGFCTSVCISGNYAYMGKGMSTDLLIVDITNPTFPVQVASKTFPSGGGIFGLAKQGNALYVAAGGAGIYSIDVSNSSSPIVLDSITTVTQSREIITHSWLAFSANYDGLKVIDISNPSNINVISSIGSGYESVTLDTVHSLVFAGKTGGGVDVFSYSNPWSLVPEFSIPSGSGGTVWDMDFDLDHLYISTDTGGLFVYLIWGGSAIFKAGFPNSGNGQSFAVEVQDSLILLSGLVNGVAILEYSGSVGIDEHLETYCSPLFPNPANSYFEFDAGDEMINEIEIININGQLIQKNKPRGTSNRVDVSALPPGQYIVKLKTNKKSWCKKLTKS
jgi:hypothetical protein